VTMWYSVNDKLAINQLWINFMPSWWNKNYGVTYGRRNIFDPDYRVELAMFQERTLSKRFPEVHIGNAEPKPAVIQPEFYNAVTPAGAGCEVVYPDDNYPWNHHLPEEKLDNLQPRTELKSIFPYCEIIKQVQYLNNKYKENTRPFFHPRGILNDAVLIAGSEILEKLLFEPEKARKVLDYTFSVSSEAIRLDCGEFDFKDVIWLANCSSIMIGPQNYIDWQYNLDRKLYENIRSNAKEFGIHHCGKFDIYANTYRRFEKINWLEIGWESDLKIAMDTYPETIIQYVISSSFLAEATLEAVRAKMVDTFEKAKGNLHRLRIHLADIDFGTPDDNVIEVYRCCKNAK
jgi:uroporphyrinogen-III decarboxylase